MNTAGRKRNAMSRTQRPALKGLLASVLAALSVALPAQALDAPGRQGDDGHRVGSRAVSPLVAVQ